MEGQPLGAPSVPEFLALLEDKFHKTLSSATSLVRARTVDAPEEDEDGRAPEAPAPYATSSIETLHSVTKQRALASGKPASKLMHKDSSERLLDMA